MSIPQLYQIDDIKSRFQKVALTNHYQAFFQMNAGVLRAASLRGVTNRFVAEDLGLYVCDAVLPGSSFADIEVAGDRQGITERTPYSRIYDDITFTFYVDYGYNVMKFFESWIEYINPLKSSRGGRNSQVMRLTYPDFYKCDIQLWKFNKDAFQQRSGSIGYTFFRAWPYSVSSTPVSYNGSNVLQLNVTFRYDRYIVTSVTISEEPETIIRQQKLWEQNLLDATGGGIALTGAGTLQELFEITNRGGSFGGPQQGVPGVNPRGEEVTTPPVFQGNFGPGPNTA